MPDKPWKAAERQTARALEGERVSRGDNFARSDTDVKLPDPRFKIDVKYRRSHAVWSMHEEVKRKYCKSPEDIAVLVLKEKRRHGLKVVIDMDLFRFLLAHAPGQVERKDVE